MSSSSLSSLAPSSEISSSSPEPNSSSPAAPSQAPSSPGEPPIPPYSRFTEPYLETDGERYQTHFPTSNFRLSPSSPAFPTPLFSNLKYWETLNPRWYFAPWDKIQIINFDGSTPAATERTYLYGEAEEPEWKLPVRCMRPMEEKAWKQGHRLVIEYLGGSRMEVVGWYKRADLPKTPKKQVKPKSKPEADERWLKREQRRKLSVKKEEVVQESRHHNTQTKQEEEEKHLHVDDEETEDDEDDGEEGDPNHPTLPSRINQAYKSQFRALLDSAQHQPDAFHIDWTPEQITLNRKVDTLQFGDPRPAFVCLHADTQQRTQPGLHNLNFLSQQTTLFSVADDLNGGIDGGIEGGNGVTKDRLKVVAKSYAMLQRQWEDAMGAFYDREEDDPYFDPWFQGTEMFQGKSMGQRMRERSRGVVQESADADDAGNESGDGEDDVDDYGNDDEIE